MSAKDISLIDVDSTSLSNKCKKLIETESLSTVILYAVDNTRYLIDKIENTKI